MAKITGILPNDAVAEQVVKQLSSLNLDHLDWTIQTANEDTERIIPAVGWRAGGSTGSTAAPLGLPFVTDYPEDEALANEGVDRDDAEYLGRAAEDGATLIIIDVSDDYEDKVRAILEDADASMISTD
jgi:hypothetical protein